jgi:hypothetical protein
VTSLSGTKVTSLPGVYSGPSCHDRFGPPDGLARADLQVHLPARQLNSGPGQKESELRCQCLTSESPYKSDQPSSEVCTQLNTDTWRSNSNRGNERSLRADPNQRSRPRLGSSPRLEGGASRQPNPRLSCRVQRWRSRTSSARSPTKVNPRMKGPRFPTASTPPAIAQRNIVS